MASLRKAIQRLRLSGLVKRIFVVGCFIGPRVTTKDVDLLVTIDPAAGLAEREAGILATKLEVLRKALAPEVDLTPIDDDLPAVDEAIKIFQRDKAEHGGHDRGILQLVI